MYRFIGVAPDRRCLPAMTAGTSPKTINPFLGSSLSSLSMGRTYDHDHYGYYDGYPAPPNPNREQKGWVLGGWLVGVWGDLILVHFSILDHGTSTDRLPVSVSVRVCVYGSVSGVGMMYYNPIL